MARWSSGNARPRPQFASFARKSARSIENVRYLATLENLFERDGQPGHQIVFLFDADFADRSHYAAELIIGTESSGKRIEAVWVDVSQPLDGPLYPQGLLELLMAR